MAACSEEVAKKDGLREEIKSRLLYTISTLVDEIDLERAATSILSLFDKDLPTDYERWKPQEEEVWFSIIYNGEIIGNAWHNTTSHRRAYELGNCFKSRTEAEQAREKIKEVLLTFHHCTRDGAASVFSGST